MKLVVGAPTAEATNCGVRVAEVIIIVKYSATVNLRRLLLRRSYNRLSMMSRFAEAKSTWKAIAVFG